MEIGDRIKLSMDFPSISGRKGDEGEIVDLDHFPDGTPASWIVNMDSGKIAYLYEDQAEMELVEK